MKTQNISETGEAVGHTDTSQLAYRPEGELVARLEYRLDRARMFKDVETISVLTDTIQALNEMTNALSLCVYSLDDLAKAYPNDATFDDCNDGFGYTAAQAARAAIARATGKTL